MRPPHARSCPPPVPSGPPRRERAGGPVWPRTPKSGSQLPNAGSRRGVWDRAFTLEPNDAQGWRRPVAAAAVCLTHAVVPPEQITVPADKPRAWFKALN